MANDPTFMPLSPYLAGFPRGFADDPDILFNLDDMGYLLDGDKSRKDSHHDLNQGNGTKKGTFVEFIIDRDQGL